METTFQCQAFFRPSALRLRKEGMLLLGIYSFLIKQTENIQTFKCRYLLLYLLGGTS